MRQVRIVLVDDSYYDNYSNESIYTIRDSITDWETISEEDYDLLRKYHHKLEQQCGRKAIILEKDPKSVKERIDNIQAWLQEQKDLEEQEKRKREEAARQRALKKMLKKSQSELALLEELKRKYPQA